MGGEWGGGGASGTLIFSCIRCIFLFFCKQEMQGPSLRMKKQEDQKVLRHSPDLLNNVKTGQSQLQLIMKHILFYHIWGLQPFWFNNLNNLTAQ